MKRYLFIILFFAMAYLSAIFFRPGISPDEYRYAEVPREMLASGDMVVPRLLGVHYFEKPILGYWLVVGCQKIFGNRLWTARIPAALATLFTALLLAMLVKKYLPNRSGLATIAGVAYLSAGIVFGVGTTAVLDSQLTFFLTLALISFFGAIETAKRVKFVLYSIIGGVAMGTAFLTKGFLAFVVPVVTLASYLVWQKKWRYFWILPWLPLLSCLLVILPWALAVHQKAPNFWHYFIFVEHIDRFFSPNAGQHSTPFWVLLPPLLGGIFPGALVAIDGVIKKSRWKSVLSKPIARFALCGVVAPLFFFSLSRGKLATYVLPCVPFLILFLSLFAEDWENGVIFTKILYLLNWLFVICGVLLGVALFIRPNILSKFISGYDNFELFLWIISGCCLSFIILLLPKIYQVRRKIYCCGFVVLFALAMGLISAFLPDCGSAKLPERDLRSLIKKAGGIPEDAEIYTVPTFMQCVAWITERDDIMVTAPGEIEYGNNVAKKSGTHQPWVRENVVAERMLKSEGPRIFYIHRVDRPDRINRLPKDKIHSFQAGDMEIFFTE